jgi:hypothetical protein
MIWYNRVEAVQPSPQTFFILLSIEILWGVAYTTYTFSFLLSFYFLK